MTSTNNKKLENMLAKLKDDKKTKMTSCQLSWANLKDDDMKRLCHVLEGNSPVVEGEEEKEGDSLCSPPNHPLRTMNVSSNKIGNMGIHSLALCLVNPHLPTMAHLMVLELYHNEINEEGAQALAEALKYNQSLQVLDLQQNQIGSQGLIYFAEALQVNTTLTSLDIGHNWIGNVGGRALLACLQQEFNFTLTFLSLDGNTSMSSQIVNDILALIDRNFYIQDPDLQWSNSFYQSSYQEEEEEEVLEEEEESDDDDDDDDDDDEDEEEKDDPSPEDEGAEQPRGRSALSLSLKSSQLNSFNTQKTPRVDNKSHNRDDDDNDDKKKKKDDPLPSIVPKLLKKKKKISRLPSIASVATAHRRLLRKGAPPKRDLGRKMSRAPSFRLNRHISQRTLGDHSPVRSTAAPPRGNFSRKASAGLIRSKLGPSFATARSKRGAFGLGAAGGAIAGAGAMAGAGAVAAGGAAAAVGVGAPGGAAIAGAAVLAGAAVTNSLQEETSPTRRGGGSLRSPSTGEFRLQSNTLSRSILSQRSYDMLHGGGGGGNEQPLSRSSSAPSSSTPSISMAAQKTTSIVSSGSGSSRGSKFRRGQSVDDDDGDDGSRPSLPRHISKKDIRWVPPEGETDKDAGAPPNPLDMLPESDEADMPRLFARQRARMESKGPEFYKPPPNRQNSTQSTLGFLQDQLRLQEKDSSLDALRDFATQERNAYSFLNKTLLEQQEKQEQKQKGGEEAKDIQILAIGQHDECPASIKDVFATITSQSIQEDPLSNDFYHYCGTKLQTMVQVASTLAEMDKDEDNKENVAEAAINYTNRQHGLFSPTDSLGTVLDLVAQQQQQEESSVGDASLSPALQNLSRFIQIATMSDKHQEGDDENATPEENKKGVEDIVERIVRLATKSESTQLILNSKQLEGYDTRKQRFLERLGAHDSITPIREEGCHLADRIVQHILTAPADSKLARVLKDGGPSDTTINSSTDGVATDKVQCSDCPEDDNDDKDKDDNNEAKETTKKEESALTKALANAVIQDLFGYDDAQIKQMEIEDGSEDHDIYHITVPKFKSLLDVSHISTRSLMSTLSDDFSDDDDQEDKNKRAPRQLQQQRRRPGPRGQRSQSSFPEWNQYMVSDDLTIGTHLPLAPVREVSESSIMDSSTASSKVPMNRSLSNASSSVPSGILASRINELEHENIQLKRDLVTAKSSRNFGESIVKKQSKIEKAEGSDEKEEKKEKESSGGMSCVDLLESLREELRSIKEEAVKREAWWLEQVAKLDYKIRMGIAEHPHHEDEESSS